MDSNRLPRQVDGLDSTGLQKEERTSKSVVDINNKKGPGAARGDRDEALDLVKDRSEWRNCTARCALAARGRTKVR